MADKEQRCAECRGQNVQCVEWIYPNIVRIDEYGRKWAQVVDGDPFSDGNPDYNWCEDCGEHCLMEACD
jgi:hypothetical protein